MTDLRKAAERALFRLLGDENHGIQLRAAVALLQAPVREWVGLTDEERRELRKANQQHDTFAKAIEAKLKEKNT